MASSSSSKHRRSYDVFPSFRGTDVRNNFLGHLYTALEQRGINTYMDSEELGKGEQISPALMEAIEESRIAIVVFSENYASSAWCLEELAKIMECKEQRHLMVFPVFYRVEPCEVRTPRESYLKAMAKHEDKFGKDSEKVTRWKKTLFEAGSLSGWHYTDGYEPGLIQDIVQEISTQLDRTPLDVAKYPIGIDSQVQELKTILNLQSKDDVLMVGLWGQGGVGKTTLAKAIYNTVFREFQGSSCLERVRENSKNSNDFVRLQEKLLSEVFLGKKLTVYSVGGGSQLIQDRLCNKKVLIILDDVDDESQLNALAGNCEWFGKGSRIIITTRNRHLLTSHGVDWNRMYKVKALENGEALELFRKHAFLGNQKIEIRSDLVDRVVHYARGLPLALEVLGSFLCDRREHQWENTLEKLARSPHKKINDVLKVSYDGLEPYEKEIFLDIACFFKGQKTKYIRNVLDSCNLDMTIGVEILIERSLISEEVGTLQMHDLIQSMGMDIVKEECLDDPGKRSRLWFHDDVLDVLLGDTGTNAIKAIVLELPKPEEMYIGSNAFKNMTKLRLLILRNVDNHFQGPIHLPNELRWFEWPHCASIPEFSVGPNKLVGLDMRNSKIEVGLDQFKDYKKLKFINFSKCESVVRMPDLYCTPYLEELDLHGCKNLEHLPDVLRSKNLQLLNLNDCSKLQRFPHIPDKIKGLQELMLHGTSIEALPTSIENLVSLECMDLYKCKELAILPSSIYRLQNLKLLLLDDCPKLINFPKEEEDWSDPHTKKGFPKLVSLHLRGCNLSEVEFLENHSCFPSLEYLSLLGNNFTNLPTCEQLYKLKHLDVSCCQGLQEILNIPGQSCFLQARDCKSLSKIPSDICGVDYSAELYSCRELASNGLTVNDLFKPEHLCTRNHGQTFILPGEEMPEWFLPNKEGYISFMASEDLFEKFIGLAFCVVFGEKEEEQGFSLQIRSSIDGESQSSSGWSFKVDSDHVWLSFFQRWWRQDTFGSNDWHHFQFIIRATGGGIVKKCGFRLMCKPLENDLEFFLQHNHLLDPSLLYEVRHEDDSSSNFVLKGSKMFEFSLQVIQFLEHEDNQTKTKGDSSNETKGLQDSQTSIEEDSSSKLVHKRLNTADFSIEKHRYSLISHEYRNVRPGGETPKEFIPVEDGTICFTASQDLYDKFLGLALCVVFGVEDGKKEISFDIVPHVNGQRRNVLSGTLGPFNSDHTWIQYLKTNVLWGLLEGGVDFGEFDEKFLRFSLRLKVSGGIVKKLGYVIRCTQLENDLKLVLEDNQFVNLASLREDSREPEDSKIDPFPPYFMPPDRQRLREYSRKCHLHREHSREPEDSEIDPFPPYFMPPDRQRLREYSRKCHLHREDLEASDSETDQTGSSQLHVI